MSRCNSNHFTLNVYDGPRSVIYIIIVYISYRDRSLRKQKLGTECENRFTFVGGIYNIYEWELTSVVEELNC